MIVPLLIPVCVETNAEKLSFVPSEEKKVAAGVPHRRTVTFFKGNEKSIRDEDRNPMLQKRQLSKNNRYFNEQNLRMHRGIVSDPLDYRIPRSDIEGTGGLAHKMAKDALKSPKVQETIRKLSRVSPPGHLQATVKIPMTKGNSGNSKASEDKRNRKGVRHKGRKKKKKKRHHRRYMKQPTQIKRGSPKNYPTNDRIATLNRNSRVLGPDEATFNYAPNYGVLDYRSQNYDTSYPAPNVPAEVPEDPQVFEGNNVSELSNNYETFEDPNKPDGGVRQPVVESQNPDQFEYSNSQYEIPGEQYQSLSTNMPQNLNLNGAVEPLIQPQYLNNYQIDSNPLGGNFDQTSIMSQAESMRIPNADTYFPIQFYNNQQDSQENQIGSQDKSMDNYALQSTFYNRPSVNLPNAMDQPLGKILESLGINVNGGQNNNNKEINMNENRQILPYSNNDRTLDVINFIRKRPYDESTGYGDSNFRGLDYQSFSKNNVKEDQRQSSLNQNYSFGKENVDRDHTNITGAVRDTKQVANEILDTIMEELEDLKDDRMKNNKNREGLPCRLSGSWSTTQAGVKLDMRVVNRTIVVTLSNFTSSRLQESLLNETWNVSGHVPFKRGLPFTLIATHNYTNSIAVFVGACRVCQGIDTIAGVWSVARQPKDCKDLQAATSVFNDIFRKTQLSSLKEGENTDNATLKHNKTKS